MNGARDLRVGDESNLDKIGAEEEDLPEEVEATVSWVLDNDVTFAPVALGPVLFFVLGQLLLIVLLLEE